MRPPPRRAQTIHPTRGNWVLGATHTGSHIGSSGGCPLADKKNRVGGACHNDKILFALESPAESDARKNRRIELSISSLCYGWSCAISWSRWDLVQLVEMTFVASNKVNFVSWMNVAWGFLEINLKRSLAYLGGWPWPRSTFQEQTRKLVCERKNLCAPRQERIVNSMIWGH